MRSSIFSNEAQPGSYAARNKGISIAKGRGSFTDSDCIPAPIGWSRCEASFSGMLENSRLKIFLTTQTILQWKSMTVLIILIKKNMLSINMVQQTSLHSKVFLKT